MRPYQFMLPLNSNPERGGERILNLEDWSLPEPNLDFNLLHGYNLNGRNIFAYLQDFIPIINTYVICYFMRNDNNIYVSYANQDELVPTDNEARMNFDDERLIWNNRFKFNDFVVYNHDQTDDHAGIWRCGVITFVSEDRICTVRKLFPMRGEPQEIQIPENELKVIQEIDIATEYARMYNTYNYNELDPILPPVINTYINEENMLKLNMLYADRINNINEIIYQKESTIQRSEHFFRDIIPIGSFCILNREPFRRVVVVLDYIILNNKYAVKYVHEFYDPIFLYVNEDELEYIDPEQYNGDELAPALREVIDNEIERTYPGIPRNVIMGVDYPNNIFFNPNQFENVTISSGLREGDIVLMILDPMHQEEDFDPIPVVINSIDPDPVRIGNVTMPQYGVTSLIPIVSTYSSYRVSMAYLKPLDEIYIQNIMHDDRYNHLVDRIFARPNHFDNYEFNLNYYIQPLLFYKNEMYNGHTPLLGGDLYYDYLTPRQIDPWGNDNNDNDDENENDRNWHRIRAARQRRAQRAEQRHAWRLQDIERQKINSVRAIRREPSYIFDQMGKWYVSPRALAIMATEDERRRVEAAAEEERRRAEAAAAEERRRVAQERLRLVEEERLARLEQARLAEERRLLEWHAAEERRYVERLPEEEREAFLALPQDERKRIVDADRVERNRIAAERRQEEARLFREAELQRWRDIERIGQEQRLAQEQSIYVERLPEEEREAFLALPAEERRRIVVEDQNERRRIAEAAMEERRRIAAEERRQAEAAEKEKRRIATEREEEHRYLSTLRKEGEREAFLALTPEKRRHIVVDWGDKQKLMVRLALRKDEIAAYNEDVTQIIRDFDINVPPNITIDDGSRPIIPKQPLSSLTLDPEDLHFTQGANIKDCLLSDEDIDLIKGSEIWPGFTKEEYDTIHVDNIYYAQLKDAYFCPICIGWGKRETGCLYMNHSCIASKWYHPRLYARYMDRQNNKTATCIDCGRICLWGGANHQHFGLSPVNATIRDHPIKGPIYARYCTKAGGGSLLEKAARVQMLADVYKNLTPHAGKITKIQVAIIAVESCWLAYPKVWTDASFRERVFSLLRNQKMVFPEELLVTVLGKPANNTNNNNNMEIIAQHFETPIVRKMEMDESDPISAGGPNNNSQIIPGIILRHQTRNETGNFVGPMAEHDILEPRTLKDGLSPPGYDGKCFLCNGIIWPQEVEAIVKQLDEKFPDEDHGGLTQEFAAKYRQKFIKANKIWLPKARRSTGVNVAQIRGQNPPEGGGAGAEGGGAVGGIERPGRGQAGGGQVGDLGLYFRLNDETCPLPPSKKIKKAVGGKRKSKRRSNKLRDRKIRRRQTKKN